MEESRRERLENCTAMDLAPGDCGISSPREVSLEDESCLAAPWQAREGLVERGGGGSGKKILRGRQEVEDTLVRAL